MASCTAGRAGASDSMAFAAVTLVAGGVFLAGALDDNSALGTFAVGAFSGTLRFTSKAVVGSGDGSPADPSVGWESAMGAWLASVGGTLDDVLGVGFGDSGDDDGCTDGDGEGAMLGLDSCVGSGASDGFALAEAVGVAVGLDVASRLGDAVGLAVLGFGVGTGVIVCARSVGDGEALGDTGLVGVTGGVPAGRGFSACLVGAVRRG
ncbi:hypothetical protein [Glutamicibacter sp. FBE19]|uniref:hypothetical protein n=1 Tax=Glutamicibacter sp. FBE19 TaxID=2761534 RepID=UPI001FD41D08|nr:hypothetical protein [Glutamicibacter sp. FBE19]